MFILWPLLIFILAAALVPAIHSWQEKQSRDWPRAAASLENFKISQRRYRCVLECNFTYQVNGRRYSGKYSREGFKGELTHLAESLRNGPFFARYDPSRPGKFFIDPFQDVTEKA